MNRLSATVIAAIFAAIFSFASSAQVSFGSPVKFDDGWKFLLSDVSDGESVTLDDARWETVILPHDWSVKGQLSPDNASCQGYFPTGIAWYRKHFHGRQIDSELAYIYFEGVYNRSKVYLNGHLLGERPNGYVSFMYDMTPYLNRDGDNVLAVRVDHSRRADSRWYTGSGIYRDVWVVKSGKTHFAQWGVGYSLKDFSGRKAVISVDVAVEGLGAGKTMLALNVRDAAGNVVAKSSVKASASQSVEMKIADPHLWDIKDPYLYSIEAVLTSAGKEIDRAVIPAGIRTLQFDADKGFALNGNWMKIKGVCLHHDAGVLGAAVPREFWRKRFEVLKDIGVNAIRCSHNPQAPMFYDLCDEMGLLVIDEAYDEWEFPKNKWVDGWNVGVPGHEGTFDFFYDWCEADVTDMVRRDRNHPSIFMWSIGNEVDYPNDPYSHPILDGDGSAISQPVSGGYKPDAPSAMRIGDIAKRLAAYVRAVDTSRPVTGALAGVLMSNQTEYPQAVDVVGYNYTENRYKTDHEQYPGRIIYGSENGHPYANWKAVLDNDHIFGQFLWTGADYLGESREWPSRGMGTGLIDFTNNIKPGGYFRKALWSEKPFTYIGTSRIIPGYDGPMFRLNPSAPDVWNYEDGDKVRVFCYTNAAQARLLLDGKPVGEMKPFDPETAIISWEIPFKPGELKAEGCDAAGNVVSSYVISTSLRPYALKATAELSEMDAEAGSVITVSVEVLDEDGGLVKLADNNITCMVSGPATLLGLDSGDNTDMSVAGGFRRRAYNGRLVAYLRTTGMPGEIEAKFSSPLLKSTSVKVTAHKYTTLDKMMLSDPFIFADDATGMYYMTGTGGMLWKSADLVTWDGPMMVTQVNPRSWMGPRPMVWAAEIHKYEGKYYYFGTFTNQKATIGEYRGNVIQRRACHVLMSDRAEGPYAPVPGSDAEYLPAGQPTLDATLWKDSDGQPYMIFCHEWLQNWNGTVEKIRLKDNFAGTYADSRKILFRAFDSPWSREYDENRNEIPNKVTDGPFVFRTQTGRLGMIWTSWRFSEYTQGVAYSESGTLDGPWIQVEEPITPPNYGHGMIFRTFDGKLLLCCHSHDSSSGRYVRKPVFFLLDDSGDELKVLGRYFPATTSISTSAALGKAATW